MERRRVLLAGMFLLCAWLLPAVPATAQAPSPAGQEPFTIDQILSAPFPGNLTAAPTGGLVAWVFNDKGVRNLWVAGAPEYKARPLTHYNEDNGFTINNLTWTPDAGAIVFAGGDGPNSRGEFPNPSSDPAGVTRAIWIAALEGGDPRKLADGASPTVVPDGKSVLFLRRGQIWSIALEENAKPKQLIKARGRANSLRFSPDGSLLAFVSTRGDHSFIGVYDLAGKTLGWLDPAVDRDGNPAWSRDSKHIAFIRRAASSRGVPFTPRREGEPWSIRVADVATGKSHEVWRAEPGPGSVFRGVVSSGQLHWTADDHLVFPWERTGWKLLYSVSSSGGQAQLLTPGDFEVEDVSISRDRLSMIYNSNQSHIDSRDLWRVAANGSSAPQNLSPGRHIQWSPTPLSNGDLAFLWSGATQPAQVGLIRPAGKMILAEGSLPADFPSEHLVTPQQVIFPATDGMPIHGQLFLPKSAKKGARHPAVLFFHGGSRRQMLLGFHYRGYYHNAYALNQYLASRGYIVLSVNYRSGTGYGMNFREALNYGAAGASEYKDVEGAGLYLRSRPDVDPSRIGLWGGSYGGYLTALGLARASDLFAAGVDLHGVHDWNKVIRNFQPAYDPAKNADIARLAFASSPMASMDTWRSPVLLIHGDDDRNVPFSESVDLAAALRKQDVKFEQIIFPDEVHGFLMHKSWLTAYKAAIGFFEKTLKQ